MPAAVVQIQARLGSSRLPGKVLFHLGKRRIVEWVITRAREASTPKEVVLTIGDRPENEALVEWAERSDVHHRVGPEEDLLRRHLQTAREFDAGPVVRLTGDCPFVPPSEIDRLVAEHRENDADYTTNVFGDMPVGVGVDVIDRDALETVANSSATHPVMPFRDSPEDWSISYSAADPWESLSDYHLAVDTPSDYWLLVDAIAAVGADPQSVLSWVAND